MPIIRLLPFAIFMVRNRVIHILSEDENAPWGVMQNREQIIEGPSWQAHEAWKEARCQETER